MWPKLALVVNPTTEPLRPVTVMASPLNPVELAGDYFHIRPVTMANYPGFSDRGTRVEVRKVG